MYIPWVLYDPHSVLTMPQTLHTTCHGRFPSIKRILFDNLWRVRIFQREIRHCHNSSPYAESTSVHVGHYASSCTNVVRNASTNRGTAPFSHEPSFLYLSPALPRYANQNVCEARDEDRQKVRSHEDPVRRNVFALYPSRKRVKYDSEVCGETTSTHRAYETGLWDSK